MEGLLLELNKLFLIRLSSLSISLIFYISDTVRLTQKYEFLSKYFVVVPHVIIVLGIFLFIVFYEK